MTSSLSTRRWCDDERAMDNSANWMRPVMDKSCPTLVADWVQTLKIERAQACEPRMKLPKLPEESDHVEGSANPSPYENGNMFSDPMLERFYKEWRDSPSTEMETEEYDASLGATTPVAASPTAMPAEDPATSKKFMYT